MTTRSPSKEPALREAPHLLSLPAELRESIWEYAVVATADYIELPRMRRQYLGPKLLDNGADEIVRTFVAVSAVCRQLNAETKTCFFGKNAFGTWACGYWIPGRYDNLGHAMHQIKHFFTYCYLTRGTQVGETRQSPGCVLDLRFDGSRVSETVVLSKSDGPLPMQRLVAMRYLGGREMVELGPRGSIQQADAARRVQPAPASLRWMLQADGRLIPRVLRELVANVGKVWREGDCRAADR